MIFSGLIVVSAKLLLTIAVLALRPGPNQRIMRGQGRMILIDTATVLLNILMHVHIIRALVNEVKALLGLISPVLARGDRATCTSHHLLSADKGTPELFFRT